MKLPRHQRSIWSIYRNLVWVGVMIFVGLTSALLGDRWWDYSSWVLLGVPIVLFGYFVMKRSRAM